MNTKPLWSLISMLVLVFAILGLYSFVPHEITIAETSIEKTRIKQFFIPDTLPGALAARSIVWKADADSVAMDSTSQRILLIGDSMLEGLMWRARHYAEANDHDLKPVIWYSSSSKWYGETDTLDYYIRDYKPTYIIMVLGANELFVRDIIGKRDEYVKNIVNKVDTLPFIWVGPPNWKEDTGINDLIAANLDKRQFFISKDLTFRRTRDGAHPTRSSSSEWMDTIASWIMQASKYPILLNPPTEARQGTPNATLIQPIR